MERLRKEFPDLPIVIDFRDEWLVTAFDLVSFLFSRSERARRIAQDAEARAVKNATAVVAVTEAARRVIRSRYPQEPEGKFQLVPNGFDATKLRRSTSAPEPRSDGKIIVTHVGTIYASTEPATLVEALESLPPELRSRFKLRFIGHIEEPRFREALLRLGDMVELKGFMPQREALAAMNETDYVLLINHDPLNVGGKFYDYVGRRQAHSRRRPRPGRDAPAARRVAGWMVGGYSRCRGHSPTLPRRRRSRQFAAYGISTRPGEDRAVRTQGARPALRRPVALHRSAPNQNPKRRIAAGVAGANR